jgi:PAS domain S-box-containing protein
MNHHSFYLARLFDTPLALQTMATAGITFCLGVLSALRERNTSESIAFFKLTSAIALWLFGFAWMYASADEETACWWAKISYIGIALIPAAAFEFSTMLMQDFQQLRKWIQAFWAIGVFFLIAILATNVQFGSMYRYEWGFYPRHTLTSIPFLIYFFGLLMLVLWRYVKGFRQARKGSLQWKQGRLMLLAYLVSNIGLADFLPSWGIAVYPFGFVAIILFTLILFYTISRYRFVAITPSFAVDRIIGIMDDGLLVLDNEGYIQVVNNSLCRMFGAEQGSLMGMQPSEVLTEGDGFGERLESALRLGELSNHEIEYRKEGLKTRTFSLVSSIMRDHHGEQQAIVCVVRDISEQKCSEQEREQLISQLQNALANVRQLSGMLPICACCKKIRDDQGYWQQIESYIRTHTEAEFTHSMCPACADKAYKELAELKKGAINSSGRQNGRKPADPPLGK